MAILDRIGSQSVQQGTKLTWAFYDGEVQTLVYKGDRTAVLALYNAYKTVAGFNPTYDQIDYDPGKGNATLTLRLVNDSEPQYELMANEVMQHVSQHSTFDSLTDAQIIAVLQAIEDKNAAYSGNTAQNQLFKLLVHGIEEYPVSQYVLRETKTVSKRSSATAAFTDVGSVVTPPNTAAVNTLIGSLPTGEWIKKSPVVRQIGSRRWQIVTEWWWTRKASSVLYSGGTYLT